MKIATWNVGRLKCTIAEVERLLNFVDVDILVLTETDSRLRLNYPYVYYSLRLNTLDPIIYGKFEHRIAIYTKYPCIERIDVTNPFDTLCIKLEEENNLIIVYGTVMGAFGNRRKSFLFDVQSQMEDIRKITEERVKICICGDYNLSFSDNYYFTKVGRSAVLNTFKECGISIVSAGRKECIDHIAVSEEMLCQRGVYISEWNLDKKISDHKGLYVDLYETSDVAQNNPSIMQSGLRKVFENDPIRKRFQNALVEYERLFGNDISTEEVVFADDEMYTRLLERCVKQKKRLNELLDCEMDY